jgi:hypothetical protein
VARFEVQITEAYIVRPLSIVQCEGEREMHVQYRASVGENTSCPQSGSCQSGPPENLSQMFFRKLKEAGSLGLQILFHRT